MIDAVELTQRLIRCESVTPHDGGAIPLLDKLLSEAGFVTTRVDRNGIINLFARWGDGRTLGFNGHTDVVPPGDLSDWTDEPFAGVIRDGVLYGRGAADMKSGVAAFVAAAIDFAEQNEAVGSIVISITGDEEGDATDGTTAILDWMSEAGEVMDACLVGEPTCPNKMGEMIKIGRRGSMTAYLTATGVQGHSAYPHRAKNPLPVLVELLSQLDKRELDTGTDHFDPSTLAITTVDTGNAANNVIPAQAKATVNIRFNDAHSSAQLKDWILETCNTVEKGTGVDLSVDFKVSGESFITEPGEFSNLVAKAVVAETGVAPELSTSGGTSDARFIANHCPVVEFGLVGQTMHKANECVPVEQIQQLKAIYSRIITDFFGGQA